jgi:hypothetical protein
MARIVGNILKAPAERKLPSLQTEPQKIHPDGALRICPVTKCDNRNIDLSRNMAAEMFLQVTCYTEQ